MLDHRTRILEAAARVYAQHGYRGATTRRIADEAGVNEITVFRHFGTKGSLMDCVMQECGILETIPPLPERPVDPQAELTAWIDARITHTRGMRLLILQAMSELPDRPDVAPCVGHGPVDSANQLRDYVVRLRRLGLLETRPGLGLRPLEVNAAIAMLLNAYFGDAMSREFMPEMFPSPADRAAAAYVRVFLRAIGYTAHGRGASASSPSATARRPTKAVKPTPSTS